MDKKQSKLSIAIGMACVWMGTHFGPGVASGTQILVYWVKYGIWGVLASILAMGLLGYCIYCAAEFSRIYKTYNYADWTKKVWGIDWIVYLLDFSFIIVMLTALGGSLSAIGNLLNSQFGLNLHDVSCYRSSCDHHHHVRDHRQASPRPGTFQHQRRKSCRYHPQLLRSYLERHHLCFLPG